jgi:hypothetical protein
MCLSNRYHVRLVDELVIHKQIPSMQIWLLMYQDVRIREGLSIEH